MRPRDAARTLGDRLGPTTTARARELALSWGAATTGVRMLPSIVVVGAQRSGTTTMFRLLEGHPQLVRPTLTKGTGYFDDDYDHGWRWYHAHFPLRRTAFNPARPLMSFECSGYYLFHPLAAERIARDLPDVRVVVLVRDPVERALSAHRHEVARGFEDLGFDEAVALEGVRTAGEADRIRQDPSYRSFAHRHHAYLQRGEYAHQIRRFESALGRDRVHVVDADLFFVDPVSQFVELQHALGLRSWVPAGVRAWNSRPGPPLAAARRTRLLQHFEPHDTELADLLGHQPSWRAGLVPA